MSLRQIGQRLSRRLHRRHMHTWPQGTTTTCTGLLMQTQQSNMASGPSGGGPLRACFCGSAVSSAAPATAAATAESSAAGGDCAADCAAGSVAPAPPTAWSGCCAAGAECCAAGLPPSLSAACSAPPPAPSSAAPASRGASLAGAAPGCCPSASATACSSRSMARVTRRSTSSASTSSSQSAHSGIGVVVSTLSSGWHRPSAVASHHMQRCTEPNAAQRRHSCLLCRRSPRCQSHLRPTGSAAAAARRRRHPRCQLHTRTPGHPGPSQST